MVGLKETHDIGLGCVASKRGSKSKGLQSAMRPSARPTARIACPPCVDEKDKDVTCCVSEVAEADKELRDSGVSTPFFSDHR